MCGLIVTAWHAHVSAQHPVWGDLGDDVLSLFSSLSKGLYQNLLNLSQKFHSKLEATKAPDRLVVWCLRCGVFWGQARSVRSFEG